MSKPVSPRRSAGAGRSALPPSSKQQTRRRHTLVRCFASLAVLLWSVPQVYATPTVYDLRVTPLTALVPAGRTGVTYTRTSRDTVIYNPLIHGHLDPAVDGAGADLVGVHLPEGFTTKSGYDVVILMHGGGQNSDAAWGWLPNSERNAGVVYIFPNSGKDPYRISTDPFWTASGGILVGSEGCEGDHTAGCWSDTARLLQLKADFMAINGASLSGRFYLGGFSSGGIEALQVLCYAPDAFDGYIAFSAEPQYYSKDTCGQVYGSALGPLPPPNSPERGIADNFYIATHRYPSRFGVNAPKVVSQGLPAQHKYVRPVFMTFGSQDDSAMNGLPLDPTGSFDTETGPMLNQFYPWTAGVNDEESFVNWLQARLNLTVGWQDARSILFSGLACNTAAASVPGTCTTVSDGNATNTLSVFPLETGPRFDVEAIRFIVKSLGTAGAVGPHNAMGYIQARGGGHMVPAPSAANQPGYSHDYSAVAKAIAFMIDNGGLVRVP
jgi:predicted esterase